MFVNWSKKIFLQQVKANRLKTFLTITMLFIFLVKMAATVLPVLKSSAGKAETSAVQSEMDDKADKDNAGKEPIKSKFEDFVHSALWAFNITSPIIHINIFLNHQVAYYQSGHHLTVPTPPPNLV